MGVLITGLIVFLGVHLARVVGLKPLVVNVIGDALYAVFYSVISVIGFVLIIYGYILAPHTQSLWYPPEWTRILALIAVPISFVLIIATYAPCHIRSLTRHPMSLGVLLWSGGHLIANGELISIIVFGSFALWSTILLVEGYLAGGAFARPGSWSADLAVIAIGLGLSALFAYFHMQFFGVAIMEFATEPVPPGI